jgi:hypothetical protein
MDPRSRALLTATVALILSSGPGRGDHSDTRRVQDGQVRPAMTALWFSETGDIWNNNRASFGAAKRGLYKATLASGGKLEVQKKDGVTTFVFDLDVADVLILR